MTRGRSYARRCSGFLERCAEGREFTRFHCANFMLASDLGSRMPNMISWFEEYDGRAVICAVHGSHAPTDSEWSEYLKHARGLLQKYPRMIGASGLAITDGGAPSALQRKALLSLELQKPLTAVVSDNMLIRCVATALAWLSFNIRVFSPREFSAALKHLNVSAEGGRLLLEDIRKRSVALNCKAAEALRL